MATYGTIVTQTGDRLITRYLQEGGRLEITEFAVGDGGGEAYRPTAEQTALRGERWRGAVNNVAVSEVSPNVIVIDALVPADVGGFTIREAGIFDRQGNLIGVMNTPETQKVVSIDGAVTEQYIEMYLAVSSAAAIELNVDPSAVMATREDVQKLRVEVLAEAADALSAHNAAGTAHADIRTALAGKADKAELPAVPDVAGMIAAHNGAGDAHGDIRTVLSAKANAADVPTTAAMNGAVSAHNAAGDAHGDIRTALGGKANTADVPTNAAMNSAISTHNTATNAHSDIRTAVTSAQTTANAALPKNAGAMTTNPAVTTQGVRNIYAGTAEITSLTTGTVYFVYE